MQKAAILAGQFSHKRWHPGVHPSTGTCRFPDPSQPWAVIANHLQSIGSIPTLAVPVGSTISRQSTFSDDASLVLGGSGQWIPASRQKTMQVRQATVDLVLFLSRATPLSRWDRMGILEREVSLYSKLLPHLGSISIVTCGGPEELRYRAELKDIRILYNRWGLSPNLYSLAAPFLHRSALRQATVYKTNQLDGSWTAIIAGRIHHRPVIMRAGYLWAENHRQEGGHGLRADLIDRLQAFSLRRADAVVLTTEAMKQQIIKRYRIPSEKINVVPNYVDTDRVRPTKAGDSMRGRICYVGRLHPLKNIDLLLKAVSRIPDASLILIGEGEQRKELEKLARDHRVQVQFLGVLPHTRIPLEINRSEVFALPSAFEGHPKALIEAMACGIAVVGSDVDGIRDIIRHGETGLLCPPTVDGIRSALCRLLSDSTLRSRLGKAARVFVEREYSLAGTVRRELTILRRLHDDFDYTRLRTSQT